MHSVSSIIDLSFIFFSKGIIISSSFPIGEYILKTHEIFEIFSIEILILNLFFQKFETKNKNYIF